MKKYSILIAICVSLTLIACGSGSTTTEVTDSTEAQIDTTAVTTTDTTAVEKPTEEVKSDVETK